jgi:hypothetical protein
MVDLGFFDLFVLDANASASERVAHHSELIDCTEPKARQGRLAARSGGAARIA